MTKSKPDGTLIPELTALGRIALAHLAEHALVSFGILLVSLLGAMLARKAWTEIVSPPWTEHLVTVRFRAPDRTTAGSRIELYPPSRTVELDHRGEAVWEGIDFDEIASKPLEFREVDGFHRTTLTVFSS